MAHILRIDPNQVIELGDEDYDDIVGLSPIEREAKLLRWVTYQVTTSPNLEFEAGWKKLEIYGLSVLEDILDGKESDEKPFGTKGFASLYTIVYNLTRGAGNHDCSSSLYQHYNSAIHTFVDNHIVPLIISTDKYSLLSEFCQAWKNYKVLIKWMVKLFDILDKGVVMHYDLPSLTMLGLQNFYKAAFEKTNSRIQSTILELIAKERGGEKIEVDQLKESIEVYRVIGIITNEKVKLKSILQIIRQSPSLDVYRDQFEKDFLEKSRQFFRNSCGEMIDSMSTPEYIKSVHKILNDELKRVERYLDKSTQAPLIHACLDEFIVKHEERIINREGSGVYSLLVQDQFDDLERMYDLFVQVDSINNMAKIFGRFVQDAGYSLNEKRKLKVLELKESNKKESSNDPELIEGLIALHQKMSNIVLIHFEQNNIFSKALREGFTNIMNSKPAKYTNLELLAGYCDLILKGSIKLTDQEKERRIDETMTLFNFLSDKDLFAENFRDQLGKRLLLKRSTSYEAEILYIQKMKLQMGGPFTSKLEGMLNDFNLGREMQQRFEQIFKEYKNQSETKDDGNNNNNNNNSNNNNDEDLSHIQIDSKLEFNVQVLTDGFWPSQKPRDVILPPQMKRCLQIFTDWYINENNHRYLKWMHAQGEAIIKAQYKGKTLDMTMTTLQAVALLYFDNKNFQITFNELKNELGMEIEVLKRVVHSLSCGKFKILKKTGHPKKIGDDDEFNVNPKFQSKLRRFRVPMASLDNKKVIQNVQEDRTHLIQAAIVRTMKARKVLDHTALVNEVIRQIHIFQPDVKKIKQQIEVLIEREYLERDQDNTRKYHYLP